MNANKTAPDCPLCGSKVYVGSYFGWFSLASHVADKHYRKVNELDDRSGCPCGFRALITTTSWPPINSNCLLKHLYDQDDVKAHLVLAAIANVGGDK